MDIFWNRVDRSDPDGCWPWTGGRSKKGYGVLRWNGKLEYAHRVAFFLTFGVWPDETRHSCDNAPCCRPGHLLDGTRQDNVDDMHDRGRARKARGEANGMARLTEYDVRAIKKMLSTASDAALAETYGVRPDTIRAIRRGRSWRWVA